MPHPVDPLYLCACLCELVLDVNLTVIRRIIHVVRYLN